MNAWSHLPNAAHIDRVIQSIKSHPEVWSATWETARDMAYDAAWVAAWEVARDAAWADADPAAWGSILALITYDDAAKYLDMPSDQLKTWAILSEDPAAVLLLPLVIAFERISELETA